MSSQEIMAPPTVSSYQRDIFNPSLPHSDTPYASSDLSPTSIVSPSQTERPSVPRNHYSLDSTRPRGLSTASSSSSSPFVKRKPLPSTASPLATRFSSGEHHLRPALSPPVDLPFTRLFGADSPTLYENPLATFPSQSPVLDDSVDRRQTLT
jgi:hypothetical protein